MRFGLECVAASSSLTVTDIAPGRSKRTVLPRTDVAVFNYSACHLICQVVVGLPAYSKATPRLISFLQNWPLVAAIATDREP
jgi:hypothetical protein